MIIIKDKGTNSQIYVPRSSSMDENNVFVTEKEFNRILSSYAMKSDLHHKQNRLYSGKNIKTINGIDVLGEGDVTIETSNTVELTQAEYDALVSSGKVDNETLYMITDAEVKFPYVTYDEMVRYVDLVVAQINDNLTNIVE